MNTKIPQAYPTATVVEAELNRLKYRAKCRQMIINALSRTIVFICTLLLCVNLWFPILKIYGNSMSPTLLEGDVILCIKTKEATRGDIITFYHNNKLLVKRVIGLSGNLVDIDSSGAVFVNHAILDEPYILSPSRGVVTAELPIQVSENTYFVLGDKRATSLDSRSQEIGCVPAERVLGKVILRLWPLHRIGSL